MDDMPTRVLVLEDDAGLRTSLRMVLEDDGYEVVEASAADRALTLVEGGVDLMLVDLMLGGVDGFTFIRRARPVTEAPIVVISARDGVEDIVSALEAGADDYVTKPFGLDELLARLRVAGRRLAPDVGAHGPTVDVGDFEVDLANRKVLRNGAAVRLTPREWAILELLVRNPGKLITQQQMLAKVWGPGYADETHYLRVYMGQLRRKLESDPARPKHLLTEAGMGYRFEP